MRTLKEIKYNKSIEKIEKKSLFSCAFYNSCENRMCPLGGELIYT